jgi:hypothetical protein
MLSLRRILGMISGVLALTAVTVPVVALAHGGGPGGRHHSKANEASVGNQARHICRGVGTSMTGPMGPIKGSFGRGDRAHFARHRMFSGDFGGHGFGGPELTETQTKELQAACAKLGAAFETKQKADAAAFEAARAAIMAARQKLEAACPRSEFGEGEHGSRLRLHGLRTHAHAAVTGPTGPTGPKMGCEQAFAAFQAAKTAAKQALVAALTKASEAFGKALSEFETTVEKILAKSGPTGPTGPTGKKPTGPTGPTGPKCPGAGFGDHHNHGGESDGANFTRGGFGSGSGSADDQGEDENCFEGEFGNHGGGGSDSGSGGGFGPATGHAGGGGSNTQTGGRR